ncbi:MAG: dihydrofolate reductase [Bacteroidaceae bacterium]
MSLQNLFVYADEKFADLQLLRYQVKGFDNLSLRQKCLVYYLSEAALWGRDILWDQNCRYNLPIRHLLEAIYKHYTGDRSGQEFQAFTVYLKRVWFSSGIHHHYGCQKIMPAFSEAFLRQAAAQLPAGSLKLPEGGTVGSLLDTLCPVIFSPHILSKRVNQTDGEDLLLTSASNYYEEGITQHEAEQFYARQKAAGDQERPVMYGMNSKLIRRPDGSLAEDTYRSGGRYGNAIDHIVPMLQAALPYAENERQRTVINTLISFYRTGDLHTFDRYAIEWVADTESQVDFVNGFTEVYGDPLGLKASWEGYAYFTDAEASTRAQKLSENAQWFEDHSPINPAYRKPTCKGVSASVVTAAILGGDLYPSSAIGINLPNSNWIRSEHGSKSVTIGNLIHAYDEAAKAGGMLREFVIDEATLQMVNRYNAECESLHTDLHECLGHGSGRMKPGVDPDALKAYSSTIEEARADLFGLYYIADEMMLKLGLLPCKEAYQSQYYTYMMNGLMSQLVRIEPGHQIEEAHMRNRALIARWTLAHAPEAARMVNQAGKTYVEVTDYPALRKAFGTLLAEVQRIKSEGDYEAARLLVETYGVQVDATLHQEIRQRYEALHLAPYKGFINPRYEVQTGENGQITSVQVTYGEPYDQQMMRYSEQYATLL